MLDKRDIYINLLEYKERLGEIYEMLKNSGENIFHESKRMFVTTYLNLMDDSRPSINLVLGEYNGWCWDPTYPTKRKKVTIDQLKDILKPNLQTQLENAKKEVERIQKLIEEENKPKVGDLCKFWNSDKSKFIIGKLECEFYNDTFKYATTLRVSYKNCEKITDEYFAKAFKNL